MSKVMLDNWGMYSCIIKRFCFDTNNPSQRPLYYDDVLENEDICWQNFLMCCILWDDIYLNFDLGSLENNKTTQYIRKFIDQYVNVYDFLYTVERKKIPDGDFDNSKIYSLYARSNQNEFKDYNKKVLLRGYKYIIESNLLGYNYFPHPVRAKLLYDSEIFKKGFDRTLYLDILDYEIESYINSVNKLCKNQLKTTSIPVLYKFIKDNATSPKEELDIAILLRSDANVKKLRECSNLIDAQVNNQIMFELNQSIKLVRDICNEIVSTKMYKIPVSVDVALGITPGITLGSDLNLKFCKNTFHTTFLYDIAKYSIKGDMKDRYKKYFNITKGTSL